MKRCCKKWIRSPACKTVTTHNKKTAVLQIKRTELRSISAYSSVLVHEAINAKSGMGDVSRGFEHELNEIIGVLIEKILI